MIQSPETVNIHVYTLSSEKATHCILGTLPNLISHHVFDDVISVSWAVIGSGVALVGVTAGPAGFRAVVLQSATFFSIISGVAGLADFTGAGQQHVVDIQEVFTVTLNVKLLS